MVNARELGLRVGSVEIYKATKKGYAVGDKLRESHA